MRLGVVMIVGGLVLAGQAGESRADDLPPLDLPPLALPSPAAPHKPRGHTRKAEPAPSSLRQVSHDLLRGSAAQQDLERSDADLAATRPIDHRNDEFGHEIKGQ